MSLTCRVLAVAALAVLVLLSAAYHSLWASYLISTFYNPSQLLTLFF